MKPPAGPRSLARARSSRAGVRFETSVVAWLRRVVIGCLTALALVAGEGVGGASLFDKGASSASGAGVLGVGAPALALPARADADVTLPSCIHRETAATP